MVYGMAKMGRIATHSVERKNGVWWEWLVGRETYAVKFLRTFYSRSRMELYFLEGVFSSKREAVADSMWYKRRSRSVRVVRAGGGAYALYSRKKEEE